MTGLGRRVSEPGQHADRARCRSCGEPIVWLTMPGTGKKNPANADTVNPMDVMFEWGRHVSHFATCKDANQWRRR